MYTLIGFPVAEPPGARPLLDEATDDMIDSMVCPPPPSDDPLNEEAISNLIVPAPEWGEFCFNEPLDLVVSDPIAKQFKNRTIIPEMMEMIC